MASKFVRVRDKRTGHSYTTSEENAKKNAKHLETLTSPAHPATDTNGRPLPIKPKASLQDNINKAKEASK